MIVTAGLADAAGRSHLALYALLAALPVIAAFALDGYGKLISGEGGNAAETSVWVVALALATAGASVPTFWSSALVICLGLMAAQGALAVVGELRSS